MGHDLKQPHAIKKYYIHFVKFLTVAAILYYLFSSSLLDFALISEIAIDTNFIIQITSIIFITMFLGNLKWFILLKSQKINISFVNSFYLYYIGYTFNYFLPGGIAGDALKIGYITKRGQKRSVAALSIIIDRSVGLFAMLLVALFFLPSLSTKINKLKWIVIEHSELIVPYFVSISLLVTSVVALVCYFINHKKTYKKITSLLKKRKNGLHKFLFKIITAIFSYRKSRSVLFLNIIIAIIIQIIIAVCLLLIGNKILNNNIGLFSYNLASIITQIVSVAPISPGGIGVGEITFAKTLYYLNDRILLGYASVYFAFRMLSIFCCIPGIVLFVFGQKKLLHKPN
jgi:uncharacterized protein (TIRG00374 family)